MTIKKLLAGIMCLCICLFTACLPSAGDTIPVEPTRGTLATLTPQPTAVDKSTPTPPPPPTQTVPPVQPEFVHALQSTLEQRYWPFVQVTMSDPFGYSLEQSEWQSLTSAQMIAQLDQALIPEGANIEFSAADSDIAAMLKRQDPAALMGPDSHVVDILHSTGWGEDGQGEAILFIIQREDGQFRWHAAIYAPAGFPPPIPEETVTPTAVATP